MTEPMYALGLLGAIAAVMTMLVVGTFAAAGLIFNGEHKTPKATPSPARRPDAPAAPVVSQDGQAV